MGSVGSRLARKTCFALIVLGIYAGSQRLTSSGLHHISGMVSGAAGVMLTLGGAATQPTMIETGGRYGFTGLADGEYRVTPSDTRVVFLPAICSTSCNSSDVTSEDSVAYAIKTFSGVTRNTLRGVWGRAANDVWAVGDGGTILHWDGNAWSSKFASGTSNALFSVWGNSSNDVWSVGAGGTIIHWDGRTWSGSTSGTIRTLRAVWGSSAKDVWAVGDLGTIVRWNGRAWSCTTCPAIIMNRYLFGLWGSSANNVWTVGQDEVQVALFRWNGNSWSEMFVPGAATGQTGGVWGSSSDDVWAVGWGNPGIVHWNGNGWSGLISFSISGAQNALNAVWGTSSKDLWVVGDAGTVLHGNGSEWSNVSKATPSVLNSVWGSSSKDVWAVGANGTIIHWDQ
jgi:hypothetical protein